MSITRVHHHSCKSRRTKDDTPSRMSRLPAPDPNASIVSLISPFTRRFLKTIKDALPAAYTTKYPIKLTGTHVAVLVPLCNLNGNPSLLLEVREKTRAPSREVRWAHSRFSCRFSPMLAKFLRRKGRPNRRIGIACCAARSKGGGGDICGKD